MYAHTTKGSTVCIKLFFRLDYRFTIITVFSFMICHCDVYVLHLEAAAFFIMLALLLPPPPTVFHNSFTIITVRLQCLFH